MNRGPVQYPEMVMGLLVYDSRLTRFLNICYLNTQYLFVITQATFFLSNKKTTSEKKMKLGELTDANLVFQRTNY
jgi:hypothetical protein